MSFVNSSSRARKTFDLVHSTLCGASHVPFVTGACYFLLFINDHTRFRWLYLLKTKDETFSTFLKFKAMVEIQFSSKINALQSDWEGEYKPFSTHLHNLSIKHKASCPYTPQQNGRAERKNCYVVEMGLTLLAHCHAPLSFWAFAFQTSVFLINQLPTSILSNNTPYECTQVWFS